MRGAAAADLYGGPALRQVHSLFARLASRAAPFGVEPQTAGVVQATLMKAAPRYAAITGSVSADDIGGVSGAAPVRLFALLGIGWVSLIGTVLYRWIRAPYFGPTDPGPDPIPYDVLICLRIFEGVMCALAALLIWSCVVKPWWRDGLPGADGVFCLAWLTLWFQDNSM